FGALILVWWIAVASGRWSSVILPSPASVAEYLWGAAFDGSLLEATEVTVRRLLVGYLIGVAIGLPIGLFMSRSQFLDDTLGSVALGLQPRPSVGWVPLALIWFGQSETAMLFVVVMGTVGSVVIATDNGTRSIPPIFSRAARTMGSVGFHQW